MINDNSFIGRGWSFPPEFTKGGRELLMVSEVEEIKQSLEILFGTILGERIMQEDYGCNLMNYVFEEMSSRVIHRLQHMIKDAVLNHEARIKVNQVEVNIDQGEVGMLLINLDFTIPSSNSRYNLVYPFYLTEANI